MQVTTSEHTENKHIKKKMIQRQRIRLAQKIIKQKKILKTRKKKISQKIRKIRRPPPEIDPGQDQGIGLKTEDQEIEDQEVEEGTLGTDPEIDIGIVDTETHAVIEAAQKVLHADIRVEMTPPAIGTAEGHAKRP